MPYRGWVIEVIVKNLSVSDLSNKKYRRIDWYEFKGCEVI